MGALADFMIMLIADKAAELVFTGAMQVIGVAVQYRTIDSG